MNQWYLSKNGKALGPFTEDQMIEKIKNKEINHLDLVYQSGQSEWQTLNQFDELKVHFQNEKTVAKKDKEEIAEWVILKKMKSEKGSEYKQIGPFAENQVLELIDQGEIRFSDFAWKKGLETWVKISQLDPFAKPLPSSSQVDSAIYEKTSPDFRVETITDVEKRSLTNMVKIQRYNHESDEPELTKSQNSIRFNTEFATQTDLQNKTSEVSHSEDKVNLWSLEPPNDQAHGEEAADMDKTVVATGKSVLGKQKVKKHQAEKKEASLELTEIKRETKKQKSESKPKVKVVSGEATQWFLACGAFVIAATFLYLSLTPSEPKVVHNSGVEMPVSQVEEQAQPSFDSKDRDGIQQRMEKLKKNIQEVRNKPEILEKVAIEKVPSRTPVEPKVKVSKKIATETRKKTKEVSHVKPKEVKVKPLPVVKKEVKATVAPKTSDSNLVKGSFKTKSYYLQRDRKALFYSSLKAETLAVEIQREYSKLKKNKKAWGQFYGQWKKRVRTSLAHEIRDYPVRSEKYAFPKIIESFKKDYSLFTKYGESFNAKVNGTREPSGAPTNLQNIFSRHKRLAQSLNQ